MRMRRTWLLGRGRKGIVKALYGACGGFVWMLFHAVYISVYKWSIYARCTPLSLAISSAGTKPARPPQKSQFVCALAFYSFHAVYRFLAPHVSPFLSRHCPLHSLLCASTYRDGSTAMPARGPFAAIFSPLLPCNSGTSICSPV